MPRSFDYDGALKEAFERDRPHLLDWLARGVEIAKFLSSDFSKTLQRRADVVVSLVDGSVLHLEFQSRNDADMERRMALYHLLLLERFDAPVRHVVLYVGEAPLRMRSRLDTGSMRFDYELVDIREIPVEQFLASNNPADYALAILAGGSEQRLTDVINRILELPVELREQTLVQLAIVSGLRSVSGKLKLELTRMPVIIDIDKNEILREIFDKGEADAEARGRLEGETVGYRSSLRTTLEGRFGPLPDWAAERLDRAELANLKEWSRTAWSAAALTDVLGPC